MDGAKGLIRQAVHDRLGEVASTIFLSRVDKTLEQADGSRDSLLEACTKITKMVSLFIGVDEAQAVGGLLDDVMKNVK